MTALTDRIEGVLLGTAAGDALGAPYEFQPPRGPQLPVEMTGGGPWEPGEWTDDTAMAIAIAEIAATGSDLRDSNAQDALVARWHGWSLKSKDVGIQTRSVLTAAHRAGGITARRCRDEARALHEQTGRTAGNGSLMRTAPVALAYLDDVDAIVPAARAISDLTHADPEAGDAAVLWCSAIRHAVLTAALDVRIGLPHIPVERRELWTARLDAAESGRPADFPNNGRVVSALQAAWSAIATTPVPQDRPADHLRLALDAAVRAGFDTDTVAAIAGGLLGGAYGASAVPVSWRMRLHGWPGLIATDLSVLANTIVRKGEPGGPNWYDDYPAGVLAAHPHDAQVLLGDIGALRELPAGVDAVVSLCRLTPDDIRRDLPHAEVRLIDSVDPDENPHLDFVLLQAVTTVEEFRAQGRTVLLHCAAGYSRTPTVGALYGARLRGVSTDAALADVLTVLPDADPNPELRKALRRLTPVI